jgi:hypothetical protein
MKTLRFGRSVPVLCMLALLAGCAGPATSTGGLSTSPLGSGLRSSPAAQGGDLQRSLRARKNVGEGQQLLYVGGDTESWVFSYPDGQFVQGLANGSFGMCSDSNGNVYLTRPQQILEYAHGSRDPIATIPVSGTPLSCAIDPTTGDLAAVVSCFATCTTEVVVFQDISQPPVTYQAPGFNMLYCGYDNAGNLYVDGTGGSQLGFAELPLGGSAFQNISVPISVTAPGQVQWDGKYITVEGRLHPVIYRIAVTGSSGVVVGTVKFKTIGLKAGQSWIAGKSIAIPVAPARKRPIDVRLWNYPQGGTAKLSIKYFIERNQVLDGLTVSVVPPKR